MATAKNGPVRIVKSADTGTAAPAIVATVPSILAGMCDPLGPDVTLGAVTLREKTKNGGTPRVGSGPAWTWPESLRESARLLEPKFQLNYGRGNGSLPYGKPNKKDQLNLVNGIVEPIPSESARAVLSSQIIVDLINGEYGGHKLTAIMANGDKLPLVWFLEIAGYNLQTYQDVESWQSLSKLLTRFAQSSGRYCLIDKDGNLSLSTTPPV